MSEAQECPICHGIGTIEHKRCRGSGCDSCEDGELICPQCEGFGFIGRNEVVTITDEDDDFPIEEVEEDNEQNIN